MPDFDLAERFTQHVDNRAYPKTLCPSEIARSLSATELRDLGVSSWRELMPQLREMAFEARSNGQVEILQRGEVIPSEHGLDDVRGPIRIRKAHGAGDN
ncbi:hypothetical protein PV11_04369 [Exophiala sideris]|uniref:Uncharacterized protein n=1 Tax=Exophiala sideris TaxID=1016849 RepID=A0A0D1X3S9_9EURO|nr:hypothetical protein PV11_04369 [Exophiala sideris]